jgi:hypothetical protein
MFHFIRSIIAVAILAIGVNSMAANEHQIRLSQIKKFKILNDHQIYLQSEGAALVRRSQEGGILEDRHYIEGETGKFKDAPNARKPDEITLDAGQSCQVGYNGGFLKVVRVKKNSAIFEETIYLRSDPNHERKRRVEVLPYE